MRGGESNISTPKREKKHQPCEGLLTEMPSELGENL